MEATSLTPAIAQARVHPRRRRPPGTSAPFEVVEKPVSNTFGAPLEKSEVRRRFVDIYQQASRISSRGE